MRWPDLSRWTARVDVRVAVFSSLAAGAVVTLAMGSFWLRAAYETLEVLRESAIRDLKAVVDLPGVTPDLATTALERQGIWIEYDQAQPPLHSASWRVSPDDLVGPLRVHTPLLALDAERWVVPVRLRRGGEVHLSLSLADFRRDDVEELGDQLARSVALGWAAAALVGILVARYAMQPIRATAAALDSISSESLSARLAGRGTSDPLDLHVASVNAMLARLEWAFERLSAFSASAAHELRTPVNRLLNVVEVARLTARTEHEHELALEQIESAARKLGRLVEALLLLARGEEGRLPLQRKSESIGSLLGKMVDVYEPAAEERGVTLKVSGGPCFADVDGALFERAIGNLLENAIRFAPRGSVVRVELSEDANAVTVAVEDDGPGVPPRERARVFERFARLETSGQGMGLGLPIARMLAQLHGGDVWLEGAASGGARAVLRVARSAPPERPAALG
jgi:two-component system heavy metal sensor histidine kinase CusS